MNEDWYSALEQDFKSAPKQTTVARIATECNVCEATVYNWKRGEQPFNIGNLQRWAELTDAKHIMRWAGRVTNHFVAPAPSDIDGAISTIPKLLRDFAQVVETVTDALEDGRVDEAEFLAVWKEGEELIAAVYGTMLAVKQEHERKPLRTNRAASLRAMA